MPKRALIVAVSLVALVLVIHLAGGTVLVQYLHGLPLYVILAAIVLHGVIAYKAHARLAKKHD